MKLAIRNRFTYHRLSVVSSRRLAFFPRDSEEIEFSVTGFAKHLTRVSCTLAIVIQYKTAGYTRINDVQKVTRLKLQKA